MKLFLVLAIAFAQLSLAKEPESDFERGLRKLPEERQKEIVLDRMTPKQISTNDGNFTYQEYTKYINGWNKMERANFMKLFCWDWEYTFMFAMNSWALCGGFRKENENSVSEEQWAECVWKKYLTDRDGPECDRDGPAYNPDNAEKVMVFNVGGIFEFRKELGVKVDDIKEIYKICNFLEDPDQDHDYETIMGCVNKLKNK